MGAYSKEILNSLIISFDAPPALCYLNLMPSLFLRVIFFLIGAPILLVLAAPYISGVSVTGDWVLLGKLGVALGAANLFVLPILRFFLAPFILLTFGLISIPLNMLVLAFTLNFVPALNVSGLLPLFWLSLILGALHTALAWIFNASS